MPTFKDLLSNLAYEKVIYSWRNKRTYLGETKESDIGPKGSRTLKKGIQELRDNEECVGIVSRKQSRKVRYRIVEGQIQHEEVSSQVSPFDEQEIR